MRRWTRFILFGDVRVSRSRAIAESGSRRIGPDVSRALIWINRGNSYLISPQQQLSLHLWAFLRGQPERVLALVTARLSFIVLIKLPTSP
jgi:hypothetical protein